VYRRAVRRGHFRRGWSTLLVVAALTPVVMAATPLPPDVRCRSAMARHLADWGAGAEAFRDPDGALGTRSWRVPTAALGVWVVLRQESDGAASLTRIDPTSTTQLVFEADCVETTRTVARPRHQTTPAALRDDELKTLLSSDGGVVYLWSPHMPLSVDGHDVVAGLATELGIAFVALLDPRADPAFALSAAREAGLPSAATRSFDSVELTMRQLSLHAPSILVFARGRFAGMALPGYRDADRYRTLIRERMALDVPATQRTGEP